MRKRKFVLKDYRDTAPQKPSEIILQMHPENIRLVESVARELGITTERFIEGSMAVNWFWNNEPISDRPGRSPK